MIGSCWGISNYHHFTPLARAPHTADVSTFRLAVFCLQDGLHIDITSLQPDSCASVSSIATANEHMWIAHRWLAACNSTYRACAVLRRLSCLLFLSERMP
jgi:hypothetical protein